MQRNEMSHPIKIGIRQYGVASDFKAGSFPQYHLDLLVPGSLPTNSFGWNFAFPAFPGDHT